MSDKKNGLTIIRDYHLKSEELEKLYKDGLTRLVASLQPLLSFMDRGFFLVAEVLESPSVTKNQHNRDVLHLLLARAMKNHRSIRVLMAEGLEQDALSLLRNLVDTTMTIRYIATDSSGALAQRFRDYEAIEKFKNMQKQKKYNPAWMPPGRASEIAKIEADAKSFKKKYNAHIKNWHGFSGTEDLAAQPGVSMTHDYITAFSAFCLFTHPSYLSVKDYSHKPGNLSWAPTTQKAFQLACLSTGYLLKVVETYVDHFGITSPDVVNVLNEVRTNLLAKNQAGGYKTGSFTVDVKDGIWGTLPASLQKDLKTT